MSWSVVHTKTRAVVCTVKNKRRNPNFKIDSDSVTNFFADYTNFPTLRITLFYADPE